MGFEALFSNTTGSNNTANGAGALASNTKANNNTANGASALSNNTMGFNNTANGAGALQSNTTGSNNTANGTIALFHITFGSGNTANGTNALFNNNGGGANTATGWQALLSDTTGQNNTAIGVNALQNNTTGSFNVAVGSNAGSNLTTGTSNIDISNVGVAGESNTIRIGGVNQTATFIAGIRGVTTANANAVPVMIDSAGQLGTVSSSARFKDHIAPMSETSEAILALKPVTFHYKSDKENTPQFGLIAEEVAKVNPNLVVHDENGQIYTVRYDAVNAMLLNEFLKEHCKVESLEKAMAEQQKENAAMRAMLKEQAAQIQKVSTQLEVSKPAPQTVLNNQ